MLLTCRAGSDDATAILGMVKQQGLVPVPSAVLGGSRLFLCKWAFTHRVENCLTHQFSVRPGELGTQNGARCCYVCPNQAVPDRGCQERGHPCTHLPHSIPSCRQHWAISTREQCNEDALHLHFRLLQGLTMVVMKVCVTWFSGSVLNKV